MQERPLLHLLLEANAEAACLLDESGRVMALNNSAERLTGYLESELVGRLFPGAPRISGKVENPALTWLVAPARQWIDMKVARRDGSEMRLSGEITRLGSKSVVGVFLRLRGEGGWMEDGGALADIKFKLETIFGGMADGLVLIDELGKILHFSAGAERLFGYSNDEALGANVKMLMPSPYREEHDGYLAAYRNTGVRKIIGVGREVTGRRKDGAPFPMYLSIGEIWLEGRRFFVGVTHDLTKAKTVESRLWTLSAAVEQSPVAVMICDRNGRIEYVNGQFSKLTGYSEGEIVGKSPSVLRSPLTPKTQYERLWGAINSATEWRGEIQDRKKNGELYWAYETIAPLRDDTGEIKRYLAIQLDVSAQRRDKEALAESEERFRKVAEMVGEWLWEQDAEGRYIYSSDAVRDIIGLEPEDILGKSYLSLFETELAPASGDSRGEKKPFYRIINSYLRGDGRRIYTESSGAPIFDESGRLIKWRGVDRDITARKEYEDALRVRNRAMASVNVGIVISDARKPGYPNIYVNPALSRMTGYTQDELLHGDMHMLQGPETDRDAILEIRHAIEAGRSRQVTLKNYRKNGEAFWNELLVSPVMDDAGDITHYIGVQTDVTEKRRAEESRRELEIAKRIQLALLPNEPLLALDAEIAGRCLPATDVGGDYFDYFEHRDSVDIVIADVSGHAVGAALIMTEVRSMVRAQFRGSGNTDPASVLHDLNDLLYADLDRSELFITMFCGRYEPRRRILKYANAGHNPALLLRSGDMRCRPLDADGLVIGARRCVQFEECELVLSPGDRLLLYTDGVVEAQSASGEFFGVERLCQCFVAERALKPQAVIENIIEEVKIFCAPLMAADDMAFVVLAVT